MSPEKFQPWKRKYKVIFLDVDGVLCCGIERRVRKDCFRFFSKRCAANLKYIIKRVPDIEFVISSTWRNPLGMHHLGMAWERAKLPRNCILSVTGFDQHRVRGKEIREWLNSKTWRVENWAVLDDEMSDMRYIRRDKMFKTTFQYGLTKPIAKRLVKHFLTPAKNKAI